MAGLLKEEDMKSRMKVLVVLVVMALTLSLTTSAAMAGSPFKEMVLKMMGYTAKTVEKEVDTVGRGIKK